LYIVYLGTLNIQLSSKSNTIKAIGDEIMSPEEGELDSEIVQQAKQLLALSELVEKYPNAVQKRITGLIYVLIGGGISFATLAYISILSVFGDLSQNILANTAFVVIVLFISWLITFRLIMPIARLYPEPEPSDEKSEFRIKLFWGILATVMVVTSLLAFGTEQFLIFPLVVQVITAFGNLGNYYFAQEESQPDPSSKVHLFFSSLLLLSIIPIILFPDMMFNIMVIVDMGGIYMVGIYMLISAEKVLLETTGRE
jgi:hypothetical protein